MAQIIKHRRGSLEALSAVTSSLQKGELVIASGSSNLSVTNGASIVFAVPENGQVQAVNRFLVGNAAPNTFAAGTYNGLVKGVPYYASGSSTLYLLGEGANDIPDLTGNITNFSSSVSASISALSASIGGGSIGNSVSLLNTFSGSQLTQNATLATYTGSVDTRLTEIGVVSGSLIGSASAAAVANANQNLFTQSAETRFTEIGVVSGSLISSASAAAVANANQNSFTQSAETRFTEIGVVSGSLISSASAANVSITNLNSFSGSQLTQNTALATVTGSLISSASAAAIAIANLNTNSGSYAKLNGGNHFDGTQVITGSVFITGSLTVYGSSSFANVSASIVEIGTNVVKLNTATPAVRFGGITVADSGSGAGASGSLFWDSQDNHWIYQHPSGGAESGFTARLISGPANSGSIGDEAGLTAGKLVVASGDDHISDSIVTQASDNSTISVAGDLDVSGSIIVDNTIIGPGSIFLQPDVSDSSKKLEIYNTAPSDVHIKSTSGQTFLGDDTNFVKIDDSAQTITITGVNGVFINNSLDVTGPISASAGFSGSIAGIGNVTAYSSSVSASLAAIVANVGSGVGVSIDNLNLFSGSQLTQNGTLATYTASVDTRLTEIGVVSGSLIASASTAKTTNDTQDVRLTNIESFSGSQLTQNGTLATYTGSVDTRLTEIGVVSGSLILSASAAKTTNDSQDVSITNLNSFSTSVNISVTALNSSSASQQTSIDALNSYTSSNTSTNALNAFTASAETRFTEIGVVSGSLISSASNAASRLTTLEGTGTIQGLGTGNNVTFAKVTTTGDVVVGGDLVVQGNTVTLNTATLVVEDKLITLASGSTSSATADGAGFEVAGASANFIYQHSTTAFTSSVALIAPAVTSSFNLGSAAGSSKRVAFRNTNGNLDLVPTASIAGDLLQWDGTDFVMSNIVDGGSF
jgi:acyl-coenzyme A thioesterase PaaI-like protein